MILKINQYLVCLSNSQFRYIIIQMKNKILLIFDLNETLLLIHKKNNIVTFEGNQKHYQKIRFDTTISSHQVKYRTGKAEFLELLFLTHPTIFDVAIWTSLNQDLANSVCKNLFGRHFRNLLFLLSTKRQQYQGHGSKANYKAIPIRRQMSLVYNKFPQYNESNTLVFTPYPNLLQKYKNNDVLVPKYSPVQGKNFEYDCGMLGISKYISGILKIQQDRNIEDIRTITHIKSLDSLMKRVEHHMHSPRQYI